jgi:hypothetical protein
MPDAFKASWDLRRAAFTNPIPVKKLNVLGLREWIYTPGKPNAEFEKSKLSITAKDFATKLCQHHVYAKADYWQFQAHDDLLEALEDFFPSSSKQDCTLILLKEKSFTVYANIKRFSDFAGYHTICAIGSKIKPLETGKFWTRSAALLQYVAQAQHEDGW